MGNWTNANGKRSDSYLEQQHIFLECWYPFGFGNSWWRPIGTYPNPTVAQVQNYPVNMTGVGNGDLLYWSNVGAVQQWLTGPSPTITGQYYSWNNSTGSWALATSSGGGVTNTAYSSEGNSLSLSSTLASWDE